jgi:RNA polymerase sigma factor (sigma-70 family)
VQEPGLETFTVISTARQRNQEFGHLRGMSSGEATIVALIKSCQRNDASAQHELFKKFSDRLFRISCRYIQDMVTAEDVLIVAFEKIFKSIHRFSYRGPGSLEAWLKQIVVNEALMELRKRHNFNLTETIDDYHSIPDLREFAELSSEDIYKLILELPIGYRTVFNLAVIEGYNHEEIAKQLGITPGTSRSQLFKAKQLLRHKLNREGFHYGT